MKKQGKSVGTLLIVENGDPIWAETEQIQSRVRQRAYEISLMRGHAGREVEDWLSAEAEVMSVPPMHIVEQNEVFQVKMAAAGIDPAALSVMASPERALVKCDLHHTHDEESGIVHSCDFKSATLFRAFNFPQAVDVKSIKVDFDEGMLRISAAKAGATSALRKRSLRKPAAMKSRRRTA